MHAAAALEVGAVVAGSLLLLAFALEDAFVFCFTVRALRARKVWMPPTATALAVLLFPVGWIADVLYNQTFGRWYFREFFGTSHGRMFTYRVQWHVDNSPKGKQLETAIRFATFLNAVAPEHIKRLDAAIARQGLA